MNKKIFFLIVSFALFALVAQAQLPDGMMASQSYIDTIRANYKNENAIPFDVNTVKSSFRIPVRVFIVRNIKGLSGVTTTDISGSLKTANGYFKNAGMEFFIDSVAYVDDYNYSYVVRNRLNKELLNRYLTPSRINLFVVDSIYLNNQKMYGFTYFPDQADSNIIYLNKKYAAGISLTTMLGHYMGLLSTHEYGGGQELADESNCGETGDFICDTYADPGLFNQVIDTCKYIGTGRDNSGKYFIPSVANIMSDSPDKCRCILSPMQYRRIYYYFRKYRLSRLF